MAELKDTLKTIKLNESNISVILGAIVVLMIGVLALRWFNGRSSLGFITQQAATGSSEQQGKTTDNSSVQATSGQVSTYTVQAGDSLWKISQQKYNGSGYNWIDIAKTNKLTNPNHLTVGQKLTIPSVPVRTPKIVAQKPTTSKTISGSSYTTVRGDSLWKISVAAYGDGFKWPTLFSANKEKIGKNPSRIHSGVALTIPR